MEDMAKHNFEGLAFLYIYENVFAKLEQSGFFLKNT